MKYAIVALAALLALAGPALAEGVSLHLEQNVAGTGTPADGAHTVDVSADTDGNVSVLVDGQPVLP